MRLSLTILLLPCLLLACVPPAPPPPTAPSAIPTDPGVLRRQLAALPGAVAGAGEAPAVSYPAETLFAAGAALPLAGGLELLDPLAAVLSAHPDLQWRGTVRASGGVSAAYDALLASRRLELLQRYFRNKGIDEARLALTAEASAGPPLELVAVQPPASSASSVPEKR